MGLPQHNKSRARAGSSAEYSRYTTPTQSSFTALLLLLLFLLLLRDSLELSCGLECTREENTSYVPAVGKEEKEKGNHFFGVPIRKK